MISQDQPCRQIPVWCDRGILVYGPRKAGTTLFQNLLDGSDQLLAYPAELKLKYFACRGGRAHDFVAYHAESRIASVNSSRFDAAEYERLWAEVLVRHDLATFGEYVRFDAWAVQQSICRPSAEPEMWCAKEVGGRTDSILINWRRMFPKGKALFIVREPLMVTRAVINDRRRKDIRLSLRQIVRETLDPMRVVAAQVKYLDDPYVHILSYEDLVGDTAGTMAKIADFLGIAYSPVLEMPTIFGEPQIVRTASRKTTEVFASTESWTDGLTAREQRIVSSVSSIAQLSPRYRVDYPDLRARIKGKHSS